MTDAWEMHQAETGLNPGPVWRDRGIIINTLTERNQALEERVAELEGSCQRLRDDYQGALAERRWADAQPATTDEAPDGTLLELWKNLDSYAETWAEVAAEDDPSPFAAGIAYCLDDLTKALSISRRPKDGK